MVVHKEGLKVVVFLFTEYLKQKHPLKLEGDEIGLKLLTETNGVKSRFLMLEFVAIILYQVSVNTKLIFGKIEINNFLALKPLKILVLGIFYAIPMIYSSHDFLIFFSGKRSENSENVDWAPFVFNHVRVALN